MGCRNYSCVREANSDIIQLDKLSTFRYYSRIPVIQTEILDSNRQMRPSILQQNKLQQEKSFQEIMHICPPQVITLIELLDNMIPQSKNQIQGSEFHKIIICDKKLLYQGKLKNGTPYGKGRLFFLNGSLLQTHFDQGNPSGDALLFYKNSSYIKAPLKDKKFEGHGKYIQYERNEVIYEYNGNFEDNKFHGYGEQIFHHDPNSYIFKGRFQNGARLNGVLKWGKIQKESQSNSSLEKNHKQSYQFSYTGQFNLQNQFQGIGQLINSQGTYKGFFKKGIKSGHGQMIFRQSSYKYIGEYKQGKKNGNGILYNSNNKKIYQGMWYDDIPHGTGKTQSDIQMRHWEYGIPTASK